MKNANMPAMPVVEFDDNVGSKDGLTKREYFAAMAMQAFITADRFDGSEKRLPEDNATMAVDAADALLDALENS